MSDTLRSLWIWSLAGALVLLWLPLLAVCRLFDRDPVRYRTGRLFRRLGVALSRVDPTWRLEVSGEHISDPRRPYVVVSNHQSLADIPLIANVPWEMKWVAKKELFRLPVVGWMMKLAGDIAVDRRDRRSGARMLLQAQAYLRQRCSVMFFPEGTRSPDGGVGRFNDGAFHLAVTAGVPLLPLAVDGSRACIEKNSWRFGREATVRLKILPPVDTSGMTSEHVPLLRDRVRSVIVRQIAEWRGVPPEAVDRLQGGGPEQKAPPGRPVGARAKR